MNLRKRCRSCEDNGPDVSYRRDAFVVLCAACHVDFVRDQQAHEQSEPEVRAWFALEVK